MAGLSRPRDRPGDRERRPYGVSSSNWRPAQSACYCALRVFIDLLRQRFDVRYPLADQRPYASGKALVLEAQDAAGLPGEFCLVTVTGGQLLLTAASDFFLRRARWEGEIATG